MTTARAERPGSNQEQTMKETVVKHEVIPASQSWCLFNPLMRDGWVVGMDPIQLIAWRVDLVSDGNGGAFPETFPIAAEPQSVVAGLMPFGRPDGTIKVWDGEKLVLWVSMDDMEKLVDFYNQRLNIKEKTRGG